MSIRNKCSRWFFYKYSKFGRHGKKETMDQSSTADEAMAILPTTASEQLHQVSFLHISGSFIFILMNIYSSQVGF